MAVCNEQVEVKLNILIEAAEDDPDEYAAYSDTGKGFMALRVNVAKQLGGDCQPELMNSPGGCYLNRSVFGLPINRLPAFKVRERR